jgi:hypothetical protein
MVGSSVAHPGRRASRAYLVQASQGGDLTQTIRLVVVADPAPVDKRTTRGYQAGALEFTTNYLDLDDSSAWLEAS